jgi:hypothetical protein
VVASLSWNVTRPLNGTALQVANIIEVSIYESLDPTVEELRSVYVYELCDEEITKHYPLLEDGWYRF